MVEWCFLDPFHCDSKDLPYEQEVPHQLLGSTPAIPGSRSSLAVPESLWGPGGPPSSWLVPVAAVVPPCLGC